MTDARRLLPLRIALIAIGLIFIFGISLMIVVWPSGWCWGHGSSHYLTMILGVYATLGVFLLLAARDPDAHRSLIWFTIVSSLVHAGIMLAQSIQDPAEHGHMLGDEPALVIVALILAFLMRRKPAA